MSSRRPTLGLVLSGGAVRGAAHLGVLDVFEREALRPDVVVGTSIGSAIGALYLAGFSPQEMFDVLEPLTWGSLVKLTLKPSQSLFEIAGFEETLRRHLGERCCEDFDRPFRAMACDLDTGEPVALCEGDLVTAVLASCTLPGIFPPVEIGGRLLVDGGVVNNLPVDQARELGADYVVGVDLLPPFARGESPGGFFEVLERSIYLMIRGNHPPPEEMDCHIVPDIARFSFSDFGQALDLFSRGAAAAEAAVPEIRAGLRV